MTAPQRGFSPAEFAGRAARAQRLMREHRFDGLVLTTPHNIRYLTGFDSQFWESPTRPWFVVLPSDGEPIAAMGEKRVASATALALETDRPTLYIEFRKDGTPVDSKPWWASKETGRARNDS